MKMHKRRSSGCLGNIKVKFIALHNKEAGAGPIGKASACVCDAKAGRVNPRRNHYATHRHAACTATRLCADRRRRR